MTIMIDEEQMSLVKKELEQVIECMDDMYINLLKLINRVKTENVWQGETAKTFLAFISLMQQYHARFTSWSSSQVFGLALEAFSELEEHCESFYDEFVEFQRIREIG